MIESEPEEERARVKFRLERFFLALRKLDIKSAQWLTASSYRSFCCRLGLRKGDGNLKEDRSRPSGTWTTTKSCIQLVQPIQLAYATKFIMR
jgi:hypothetical protein